MRTIAIIINIIIINIIACAPLLFTLQGCAGHDYHHLRHHQYGALLANRDGRQVSSLAFALFSCFYMMNHVCFGVQREVVPLEVLCAVHTVDMSQLLTQIDTA